MNVTVASTQMACSWDIAANIDRAERLVRESARAGAQIILLQELFETPYFCIDVQEQHFGLAHALQESATIKRFQAVARELEVVLPVSFFEHAGLAYYNAVAIIDADGRIAGHYRKSHIPQFPVYEEKYYFSPGDTGFLAVDTRYGRIGVAVCWDQWFPEAARAMVLQGAEILFYPTAIGSELYSPELDSKDHWQTVMRGHAAANVVPVVASNRVGKESSGELGMEFYGSSFITDCTGAMLATADRSSEGFLTATLDLDSSREYRRSWGVFRDHRPDLYGALLTLDGKHGFDGKHATSGRVT
ncbi:MAG: N-carbamoylputrescine amidase [Xanthomonadales bacterium]|nr:N-carbamoylputrescine amidase [Xanthomonadales bacterium]